MNKLKVICPKCGEKELRKIYSEVELSKDQAYQFKCNGCDKTYRMKMDFVEEELDVENDDKEELLFDFGDEVSYGSLDCEIVSFSYKPLNDNVYYDLLCLEDDRKFKDVPQEALEDQGNDFIPLLEKIGELNKEKRLLQEEVDMWQDKYCEKDTRVSSALHWWNEKDDPWKAEKILKEEIDIQW